jgi:hypothetical protein
MVTLNKSPPLCRHHHHRKQARGWRLEQPEPGVLIWHTPVGHVYVTRLDCPAADAGTTPGAWLRLSRLSWSFLSARARWREV